MEAARIYPAAGWYDDPDRPGQQRWWTGRAWSDLHQPLFEPYAPSNGLAVGTRVRGLVRTVTRAGPRATG